MPEWHIRAQIHEGVLNAFFTAISEQRPSLLNYATAALAKGTQACARVEPAPNGAPSFTIIDPLVIGQGNGKRLLADYSYQLSNVYIDFAPVASGGPEHFRLTASVHIGLGVQDDLPLEDMLLPSEVTRPRVDEFLDYTALRCFSTSLHASGIARLVRRASKEFVLLQLTDFSLDSETGLIGAIATLIRTTMNAAILPQAAFALQPLLFDSPDGAEPKIGVPLIPTEMPGNPQFAGDQLALFITTA
jgi:hypothetical protein